LLPYCLGGIAERGRNIGRLQVWELGNNFIDRQTVGHHGNNGGNRDPQSAKTWLSPHLARINGDALERHT
jgi:hypothetical protein